MQAPSHADLDDEDSIKQSDVLRDVRNLLDELNDGSPIELVPVRELLDRAVS